MAQLTERQQKILKLVSKGMKYKDVSEKIGCSEVVVRQQTHIVFKKLGVKNKNHFLIKFGDGSWNG